MLLLHGLVATGDVFGAAYDALARDQRLVVPDLLGFGRSLDESRSSFTRADHLDALDDLVAGAGAGVRRWIVGGHSMGGALAVAWARRNTGRVERVVTWGAPVYRGADEVREVIGESGAMARLFVLDTVWARRACAWNCGHRRLAGLLAAAAEPGYPVRVARQASLHTWPAYLGAMEHLVMGVEWESTLADLDATGIEVVLTRGRHDPVGDVTYMAGLARERPGVILVEHPHADHRLPLVDAPWCIARLGLRSHGPRGRGSDRIG